MVKVDAGALNQLFNDVALIKEVLIARGSEPEGEVTEWAERELTKARKIPRSKNISLDELEKMISAK